MARMATINPKRRGQGRFVLFSIAPAIVLYIVFMVVPTLDVFRLSLYNWTGVGGVPRFAGLVNFEFLTQDLQFVRAFQNTVLLLVLVTIVTMAGALMAAGMMMQVKPKLQSFYRFVLYLPSILSIVVVAAIFAAIYDQSNGLINGTLAIFGGQGPVWLGDSKLVIFSIGLAMIWQSLGYYLVLYMAGMSQVPAELYEASALDGATPFRQFFDITLPLIWESIRTSLTFFVLSSVNLAFVLVRALTNGGPNGASETLLGYMYKQAYGNSAYGYGMAIGTVIFVFSFAVAFLISRSTKREVLQF